MRPWVANVIGLALGFTISGEALLILHSRNRPSTAPPSDAVTEPPSAPAPMPATPPRVLATPRPVELPRIAPPLPSQPDAIPKVIYPDIPPPEDHKPGAGVTGTGFFVGGDGSLITAAHVVNGCAQIRIASRFVKLTTVETLAIDKGQDIALLRAPRVTPPATLEIGRPAASGGRLFVLGYPASGGPLIPTETWGVLENTRLQPAPPALSDPRQVIWAEAPAVAHGFSGGPMVDPRNGVVVGIVRGLVDSRRLHEERAAIPPSGMVIGPGSSPIAQMLAEQGTETDAVSVSGDEAMDAARRATVHVLCLF